MNACCATLSALIMSYVIIIMSSQVRDKEDEEEERCEFPAWARDMGPLISFSFSSK